MKSPKVLIIIPAFNEERAIGRLIQEVRTSYPQYDMVVINDGSRDRTGEEVKRAGVPLATLPFNLGIGGAVQTGFKIAARDGYDATIQLDGDAQHDPAYLSAVLAPVLSGQADLCIGSRFLTDLPNFRSTWVRRIGIRFFAHLLGWLTGIPVTDPTSGFRATGKKLIVRFAAEYPVDFAEPEAIKLAKRFDATVVEVPVRMRKRLGGVSSIRYFATLYYMIKVTFAILIDTLREKPKN